MSGLIVFNYSCGQLKENSIQNTEKLPLVVEEADKLAEDCTTLFQKLNTFNSDMIGMSCGWGGVVTENVTIMAELARFGCYGLIDSLMDTPNGSVKFLATLTLEIAIKDSLIEADSVLMVRLDASKEVYVTFTLCEGCTGHDKVIKSIGTLIENKKKNRVLTDVRNYLRGEWTRW